MPQLPLLFNKMRSPLHHLKPLRLLFVATLFGICCDAPAASSGPTLAPPQTTANTMAPLFEPAAEPAAKPINGATAADIEAPLLQPINSGRVDSASEVSIKQSQRRSAWDLPPTHHVWARFPIGSWRTLRIQSETFDERGITLGQNTTFRTETLTHVAPDHYQLEVSSVVEVGGKLLQGAGQEVILNLVTDSQAKTMPPKKKQATTINLHGKAVPCTVWSLVSPIDRGQREELIYYSPDHAPYVLKRERLDHVEQKLVGKRITHTARVGLPVKVGQAFKASYHLLTTELMSRGGRREQFAVQSQSVPGGTVRSSETEYGPAGERIRWATVELMEMGLGSGAVRANAAPRQQLAPAAKADSKKLVPAKTDPQAKEPQTEDSKSEEPAEPKTPEPKPRRLLRLLRRAELLLHDEEPGDSPTEPVSTDPVSELITTDEG